MDYLSPWGWVIKQAPASGIDGRRRNASASPSPRRDRQPLPATAGRRAGRPGSKSGSPRVQRGRTVDRRRLRRGEAMSRAAWAPGLVRWDWARAEAGEGDPELPLPLVLCTLWRVTVLFIERVGRHSRVCCFRVRIILIWCIQMHRG
jgi:hypothetical protein